MVNSAFKFIVLITTLFFPGISSSALIEGNYKGSRAGIEIIGIDPATPRDATTTTSPRNRDQIMRGREQIFYLRSIMEEQGMMRLEESL